MTSARSERESAPYREVTGIVLKSAPIGEMDRRVVLLTKELGKISAFARGARRPNSPLVGVTAAFAFGKFRIYAGKSAYVLTEAQIDHFFAPLSRDMEKACYGSYFLEVMDYLTRENNDEAMLLLLLYLSLRALENGRLPNALIRRVFELRCIVEEGEFAGFFRGKGSAEDRAAHLLPGTVRALEHITQCPLSHLYGFEVSEEVSAQLKEVAAEAARGYFSHPFTSLTVLEALTA